MPKKIRKSPALVKKDLSPSASVLTNAPSPEEVSSTPPSPTPPQIPPVTTDDVKPVTSTNTPPPPDTQNRQSIHILIIGGISALTILGLWGAISKHNLDVTTAPSPTSTPILATPSPSPTPAPVTTIEILNGSGKNGAAGKLSKDLEALSYTVIKTGNAPTTTGTPQVYIATGIDATKLLADLKTLNLEASISGTLEDSSASARLILTKP